MLRGVRAAGRDSVCSVESDMLCVSGASSRGGGKKLLLASAHLGRGQGAEESWLRGKQGPEMQVRPRGSEAPGFFQCVGPGRILLCLAGQGGVEVSRTP